MAEVELKSNVFKTALFFEGGSMRDAYSAGVARYLLEQGVYFDHVYGVSAGSSNTVNYLSRDPERVVESFGDFMAEPEAGNWSTFLRGKGLFNAHYLYMEAGRPDGKLPFDFETFKANPAQCTIFSFNRDTGEDLYFTKDQMTDLDALMRRVRASSTIPFFMPPPTVDGVVCYDGGFAQGGGLPLQKILDDGFERILVIRTRKRGYRKGATDTIMKMLFPTKPLMRQAVLSRNERYNEACDFCDKLEAEGKAYVFYPEQLTLKGSERDAKLFHENIDAGYAQIQCDWSQVMNYVEAGE